MAMPQNMEELNAAITAKIRESFPDKQIEDIGKLQEFFPGYQAFTAQFVAVNMRLEHSTRWVAGSSLDFTHGP